VNSKLAIGAQIFVAEAASDLEVAVEAGDHQDLFEDLRRLRQRVEFAGMHAAGNQKIARAFGRGFGQNRRFDLEKALLAEALADRQRNFVAQAEVVLHLGPAQVHVAVLEPHFLVLDRLFRGRKRRQLARRSARAARWPQSRSRRLAILGLMASLSRSRPCPRRRQRTPDARARPWRGLQA
jgi:hypothetical protein